MAETPKKRVVLIAMDGSSYSDYAFDCKYIVKTSFSFCFYAQHGSGLNVFSV